MGEWLEAKQLGDAKLIGYHLAEDFLGVGPRGQAMEKRQFVAALSSNEFDVKNVESGEQSVALHGTFAS
jgi:hypothetical protein